MKSSMNNVKLSMRYILPLLLLIFSAAGSYAQSFHLGLQAGADFIRLGGRSFNNSYSTGFSGGVYSELNLNSHWGIQPELIYNETVATTSSDFNQILGGVSFQKVEVGYVSLPVLLAYRPVPELTILLGPQFSYRVSETSGLIPGSNQDAFTKYDMGLLFGGQLNLGRVKIGARYIGGFTNLDNLGGNGDTWKTHGFQTYVGFRLF